ncbi:MAG: hypothetical protein HY391_06440 [Deltaproteobacteria bacterium]|nr:hypothetical protein [Deltaproteobacteria bacterium]
MNRLILMVLFAGLFILPYSAQAEEERPILKPSPVSDVFVPQGFDDNDNAEVVLHGYFPNTCYRIGPTKVFKEEETKTIIVSAQSYYVPGICLQVMRHYWQSVSLGILEKGSYRIKIEQVRSTIPTLPVVKSSNSGPDDFLYAPVHEVALADTDLHLLTLKGIFKNDCMTLKEVRVVEEPTRVLAVLPIAHYKDNGNCKSADIPFTASVELKPSQEGLYLIHVRSLNGMSFNRVEQLN